MEEHAVLALFGVKMDKIAISLNSQNCPHIMRNFPHKINDRI